jgi:membrane protease subunit HflK
VLIDAKAGSNLLYLPLDKLMKMSDDYGVPAPAPDASGAVRVTPADPSAAGDSSNRSRDALRSRDREGR